MKPVRMLTILVIVLFVTALITGCSKQDAYKLINDATEVSEIQIVWVGEPAEGEAIPPLTTLSVVDDTEEFISELQSLDINPLYPPEPIPLNVKAIYIIYGNGDYELIHYGGQAYYRADEDFYQSCAGCEYFDKNQFNALIEKYS